LKQKNPISLIFLITFVLSTLTLYPGGECTERITGFIHDAHDGDPLPDTEIRVFKREYRWRRDQGWNLVDRVKTGDKGAFSIKLGDETSYLLVIFNDEPSTEGVDYLPFLQYYPASKGIEELNISLTRGASIKMKGENLFVETTQLPTLFYSPKGPNNETLKGYGDKGLFGNNVNSINRLLGLPFNQIMIPSNTDVCIEIRAVMDTGKDVISNNFVFRENNPINLEKGDAHEVELGETLIPLNLEKVDEYKKDILEKLSLKEAEGFFLGVERQKITKIDSLIREAELLYERASYEEAHTKLREAYVELINLGNWIKNMTGEAVNSLSLLMVFLGLSALSFSLMITEDKLKKGALTLIFYAIFYAIIFYFHPGSKLVPFSEVIKYNLITLVGVLSVTYLGPRIFQGRGNRDKISIRNMIIPIFSIAKRSLRRRKIRFLLSLITITVMVASFVTLTSFTVGYGLLFNKVSDSSIYTEGVMIKSPGTPVIRAVSPYSGGKGVTWDSPLETSFKEWFEGREEVLITSPVYLNIPQRQYREAYHPIGFISEIPLFGVMAFDPGLEDKIYPFEEVLVEGSYPDSDEEGGLISAELAKTLGIQAGYTINVSILDMTYKIRILGIFDDMEIESINGLDGGSILPKKIIEQERVEMEGPDLIFEALVPCSPDEVLILTRITLSEFSGLWLSHLNLLLEEGMEVQGYSQKMALDRGLRVWAATQRGVYLSRLASYFQGKGLPIFIPWIIVVLNVILTMLNSYFERRREIDIYSSIGMNPGHITGIFLSEAVVIGIIGGSIGYLTGLGMYRVIYLLSPTLQVKQKISALWSLASIGISLAAVLVGGVIALKCSINITPSLKRRWAVEDSKKSDPEEMEFPLKILSSERRNFMDFLIQRIREQERRHDKSTRMIRYEETEGIDTINFIYSSEDARIGGFYSKNTLRLVMDDGNYSLHLKSVGTDEAEHEAGALIRKIILEWSLSKRDNING
jgi:hypothetical protein